jgi:hypothetical protein
VTPSPDGGASTLRSIPTVGSEVHEASTSL